MYKEEMVEDVQSVDQESGTKSDVLVENRSVVISIKKEVEEKHSKPSEPDQEAQIMNIDVMNQGDKVESMQPNIEEPDTESGLLAKSHPIVIGIKEEDEGEHPGAKESYRESDFDGDTNTNVDD